ncbi:uncharacterized protein LOC131168615 [Malania oleifera]|uniref:uncharacterized protein LOC131168615 n=1 Tax=Malania oleifera TaxID=397392 RepID=UPI0025ADEC0A|nr:uncharacterized protein LOC131168615 [Malania oleifera]
MLHPPPPPPGLSLSLSLSLSMMADNCTFCLIAAMDRLWFHHIILFQEPISLLSSKPLKLPSKISESLQEEDEEAILSQSSSPAIPEKKRRRRPTSLNLPTRKTRSLSSSPSADQSHRRNLRTRTLQKTMSLQELELEEVKGFMDLGFKFHKEQLSPRMASVLPGLLRLEGCKNTISTSDEEVEEEQRCRIVRPYLSEAWLIKRPNSPLLNMRVPTSSSSADMKRHLRCWARTVASVVLQES